MSPELAVIIGNAFLTLAIIIKNLISQNSNKKASTSLNDGIESLRKEFKESTKAMQETFLQEIDSIRKELKASIEKNAHLEKELSVLKERVSQLDKLDGKFDLVNQTLIQVKTQLDMLLTINGIPVKKQR